MAALKAVLKSLEGLADPIKELYRKDGEDYRLDVEGMVPKAALDEFRENNVTLKKANEDLAAKLKSFDGIDVEKVKELQETERKVKDGELIKAGKIDELIQSRLAPILKEASDKAAEKDKQIQDLSRQMDTMTIDTRLTEIGTKKGLRPTAIEDMLHRGRKTFVRQDGKVLAVGRDGAQLLSKTGEPLSMEHWVEQLSTDAPHLFQSSSGGGAPQDPGHSVPGAKVMRRAEFDKLDSAAKMKFSVERGSLID